MKILKYTEASFQKEFEAVLATSSLFDLEIEERVRTIIQKVQIEGDDGLLSLVENIDGIKLTPQQLRVAMEEEIAASLKTISNKEMDQAFKKALKNISFFAKKSLRKNWKSTNSHGAQVGEKFDPFERVGVYVPAGKAPLASTALMTIPLAKEAG